MKNSGFIFSYSLHMARDERYSPKNKEKNPGLFCFCFGFLLVLLWSCFAHTKEKQKETKRRPEQEKNKTKTKQAGNIHKIGILSAEKVGKLPVCSVLVWVSFASALGHVRYIPNKNRTRPKQERKTESVLHNSNQVNYYFL